MAPQEPELQDFPSEDPLTRASKDGNREEELAHALETDDRCLHTRARAAFCQGSEH
jgi:hypothetical protein